MGPAFHTVQLFREDTLWPVALEARSEPFSCTIKTPTVEAFPLKPWALIMYNPSLTLRSGRKNAP